MFRFAIVAAVFLCASAIADPLFEGDSTLKIVLTGPLDDLDDDRDKEKEYPGVLNFAGRDYEVELSVRGNKRLSKRTCDYPPLRIDFDNDEVDSDTLFEEQNDIKLVVTCDDGDLYEGYLRTEFLVYRAMNALSDASYRVRWATVTYIDTGDPDDPRTAPAFFVERKSRIAKRLDLEKSDLKRIGVAELDEKQAALVHLFQYIVANPDYSIIAAPPGDECCHNAKILKRESDGKYVPIIYDFDSTGVVDARYAVPHASLPIRRVTQRLYRGYCDHNEAVRGERAFVLSKRDEIVAIFKDDPILEGRQKDKAVRFIERSFEDIADDEEFEEELIEECR